MPKNKQVNNRHEWELEFDKKFVDKDGSIDVINLNRGIMEYPRAKEIKRFIKSLLASQRAEAYEKIKQVVGRKRAEIIETAIEIIKAPKHCSIQGCSRCEEQERAINILSSLKDKEK